MTEYTPGDAEELAARRAVDAKLRAKYTGWKPLVFWYAFWTVLFAIGALSALFNGQFGVFLVSAVFTVLGFMYAKYLYNGGRRRVWFVIF